MIVPVILGFYFAVCISVLLFNVWKVLSERFFRWRMVHWQQKYRFWFLNEAVCYNELSAEQQEKITVKTVRTLRSDKNLMAFHFTADQLELEMPGIFAEHTELLAKIIQRAFPYYAKKADTRQAYYSFVITRFQVMKYAPSEAVTSFLMEQIRGKQSIYNLENALRAIYSSGQVAFVMEALELLDGAGEIRIHEKLLADGLLTFEDSDKLISAIWQRFPHYGAEMQKLLLNYIRFASGNWGSEIVELLRSTEDTENKIACLRYFGKYPEERFRFVVYSVLNESDKQQWEIFAVCMSVLAGYPGAETVEYLKNGLRSLNWHVRYNAAVSLKKLNVPPEDLQDIFYGNDRYAKEMLQYHLGITDKTEKEVSTA